MSDTFSHEPITHVGVDLVLGLIIAVMIYILGISVVRILTQR